MKNVLMISILALPWAGQARADLASKVARELAEAAMKKFGKEVAEEGAERLAGRIASAAARHGDDALSAVRQVGPKALHLADEAGENAPRALRLLSRHGDEAAQVLSDPRGMALFARYGDEAAEIMMKHKGIASDLLTSFGENGVKALGAVSPRNGRRLAILAKSDANVSGLLDVIARHGDPAMDFVWRNKGALAVGTTLTAFLANPEPFINGTSQLVDTAARNVVKPVVQETAQAVSMLIWTLLVLVIGTSAAGVFLAIKHPGAAAGLGKALIGCAGRQV